MIFKFILLITLILISKVWCYKLKFTFNINNGSHTDRIESLVSLGGNLGHFASISRDSKIKIWDGINGKLVHTFENVGETNNGMPMVLLENGYLASSTNNIKVWDLSNKKLKYTFEKLNDCDVFSRIELAALEDGLLASSDCQELKIWDITDGKLKIVFDKTKGGHKKKIDGLFLLENNILASNDFDDIRLWDLNEFNLKSVYDDGGISEISSLEGGLFGSASYNLKIWNMNNGNIRFIFNETQFMHYAYKLVTIKKYNYLATGYQDGQVKVWDINTFKSKFVFRNAHYVDTDHLIPLHNGDLLSVGNDRNFNDEIKIWDMKYGLLQKTVKPVIDVRKIELLENGFLVIGSRNGTIQVYENS